MEDIRKIPSFWANLEGLAHSSNLNTVESCITRVYCMQGALNLHHWLLTVVPAAVEDPSRNSWINKLAWDVEAAMRANEGKEFDSRDYLPKLVRSSTYSYKPSKFKFDNSEIIISTVSSIIRVWLQFPADHLSLVQLSIIDIFHSKSRPSILFLDNVWETYKTPFSTVFRKWDVRRSKKKLDAELEAFKKKFSSHPFAISTSLEFQKLKYLDRLIKDWVKNYTPPNEPDGDTVRQYFQV